MSEECIFCRIIRGESFAHKIFEDTTTLAMLDIHPLALGHTLVIPKAHTERVEDLAPNIARDLFSTVQRLAGPIRRAVNVPSLTIGINDGPEAGQMVKHLHIHIVPRSRNDGGGTIHSILGPDSRLSKWMMLEVVAKITESVQKGGAFT
jgi:histidine triad (HIT) family protein